MIIVVSEETQEISLVLQGKITACQDEKTLTQTLKTLLLPQKKTGASWQAWLSALRSNEKNT